MVTVVDSFLSTSMEYMMNTATSAVVDGKMEPMSATPITQPLVVTGQYLFDNFVKTSEEQKTRMDMIRTLVGKADALQIKGACDKMVELAVLIDYPEGKPKKAERGTKEQSAMNARTCIQQAWGALEHASEALEHLGYTDATGYQEMRVLAKKALDKAGLKWDGKPIPSDADKEVARLKKERAGETKALVDIQADNPRLTGESLSDWNTRVFALAETALEKARAEKAASVVKTVVAGLVEKYDASTLFQIAEALLAAVGVEVTDSTNEETVDETEETEVTA